MARIEATKAGAESLRKLASDLQRSNNDLESCCNTLKRTISGLSGLGDFSSRIMDIVEQVISSQFQGREAVEQLCIRINALASRVESICGLL
jgi:hypothetical protein